MRSRLVAVAGAALLGLVATPAFAHHVMDGRLPATFADGLLSGLGHPVIGLDHLAFVIAAGLAVGVAGASLATPTLLVGASIAGVLVHVAAVGLPGGEFLVAASVVTAGLVIASGKPLRGWHGRCSSPWAASCTATLSANRSSARTGPPWAVTWPALRSCKPLSPPASHSRHAQA
jgi:hydrogenase/urease accessory protein HupE